jgi:RHS repeat-associated protein
VDHPDYGTAATGTEGRFSLPVEGGGNLTVKFAKTGFISAQRQLYVPWNDTALVETVSLITEDPAATVVSFDGSAGTVVTHRGSEVIDASGTRAATIVFTGDNKAYLTDTAGNKTLELKSITTRATEYSTPESMPAKLPPSSAFTWCAELAVDGAERVQFEKPVAVWVENFLGFPVGEVVPVGYYDRDKAVWVPMKNGVVVELLDTDGDGVVDALDADGDGQPDDLNQDGQFKDEVRGLTDNQKYAAGGTFWRAEVKHFSPIDFNWPLNFPVDSTPPNPSGEPYLDGQVEQNRETVVCTGSFAEEKSRIFHENIAIPGTELKLHYASNRVSGYKPGVIQVPASGEVVPASLMKIVVKLEVAGRAFETELPPQPRQTALFEWDGLDHLGQVVGHPVHAQVQTGFVYWAEFGVPSGVGRAFGSPSRSLASTGIPTRGPLALWRSNSLPIVRGKGAIAEGWSLSNHHQLNPQDPSILLKGNGTIAKSSIGMVSTIAGNGTEADTGDGGPASEASLNSPRRLRFDSQGNLFVLTSPHRIRKIDPSGQITTVADGHWCRSINYSPDGMNALDPSACYDVIDFVLDASGNMYIQDRKCILKIDTGGVISIIAGNYFQGGYATDGAPARQSLLWGTNGGIDLDREGNIYVAEYWTNQARRIDTSGILTTFAGTGAEGHSGDGGSATSAQLYHPLCVAGDAQGNIFIGEYWGIKKVDPSGMITTYAGGGSTQPPFEGIKATDALLGSQGLKVDTNGNLWLGADGWVNVVDPNGVVRTVAGPYTRDNYFGYSGDGGPARMARFMGIMDVAIDPAGKLYIADHNNHRIRKITKPMSLIQLTGMGTVAFNEENGQGHLFSTAGRHLSTVDLDTGVTLYEFGYDAGGALATVTDRFGNQTLVERGSGGVPTAIVSPHGVRTALTVDGANHLTRITYPDGRFHRFEYTSGGLATLKVQPSGNRFIHVYDESGRLREFLDEEGGQWGFSNSMLKTGEVLHETLTAEGDKSTQVDRESSGGAYQSTITDAAGAQTTVSESSDGLTVTSMLACGLSREEIYDLDAQYKYKYLKKLTEQSPSGLKRVTEIETAYADAGADGIPDAITKKIKLNGRSAVMVQDILMARKTLTTAEGRTVVSEYDPNTLVTERVQVPGWLDANYTYDGRGRLVQTTLGQRATAFAYTAQGFLGQVTDPQGRTTSFSHDALGRVREVGRQDQSKVRFDYDANGNLTVLVNPSGVAHTFGYNKVNHKSAYTTPLSGSYLYKYDKDRRPTETLFPSGRIVRNVYDKGRLARTETPEGNVYYNYLCGSKVGSITKDGEGVGYTYDGSLLTSETLSGSLNQAISYSYDNDFARVQAVYAGAATGYGYDKDGLLTQAGAFAIARDAGNGLPVAVADGRLALNRGFNGYGELSSQAVAVGGKAVSSWSLLRDATGRITRRSETVGGVSAVYDYLYDVNGRLLKVLKDNVAVEEYAYDENGTRIYEMNTLRGIPNRSYQYSDEDHLLKAGEWAYQYDLDGFLTTKTSTANPTNKIQYFYSSRGELLTVLLPDGRRIDYLCDPLGRRIAKKVNGVVVEKYLWQGLTRLLAVYDGNNTLRQRFEYADDRMPVSMTMASATYYLSYDPVGSLRLVADSSGNVVKRIVFDAFGNILEDTNPGLAVPFGFAGGLHDRDTGLVRFGFRDYDPEMGRWTAKDPIGFAGGDTDQYGYVINNPVNAVDPLGLFDLVGTYAKVEGALKPYVVGGALIVTGGVTTVAGAVTTAVGFASIPETGPAGALVTAVGGAVTITGLAQFTIGLDIYSDELRRRLGLPEWFDIMRNFEFFTEPGQPKLIKNGPC